MGPIIHKIAKMKLSWNNLERRDIRGDSWSILKWISHQFPELSQKQVQLYLTMTYFAL